MDAPRISRTSRAFVAVLACAVFSACAPPPPAVPPSTSQAIIEITAAPTQDIDATATAYALQLVPTPTPAGLYIVQRGDTLSALATEFGTTVAEIMAANGLTDPNALQVGQPLIIPSLLAATPLPGGTAIVTGTTVLTATLEPPRTPTPTFSTP